MPPAPGNAGRVSSSAGPAPLPGRRPAAIPSGSRGSRPRSTPQHQQPPHRTESLDLDSHRAGGDGGEAHLREALCKASREVIEKIAWEVVPQLAETIIREASTA